MRGGYRFGYNGKEKDDELKGTGIQYDYGFRIYDARIAKFLSVDPLTRSYPWYTPYQFAGNKPIHCLDLDGLEEINYKVVFHGLHHSFTVAEDFISWETTNSSNRVNIEKIVGGKLSNKGVYQVMAEFDIEGNIISSHFTHTEDIIVKPYSLFAARKSLNDGLNDISGWFQRSHAGSSYSENAKWEEKAPFKSVELGGKIDTKISRIRIKGEIDYNDYGEGNSYGQIQAKAGLSAYSDFNFDVKAYMKFNINDSKDAIRLSPIIQFSKLAYFQLNLNSTGVQSFEFGLGLPTKNSGINGKVDIRLDEAFYEIKF